LEEAFLPHANYQAISRQMLTVQHEAAVSTRSGLIEQRLGSPTDVNYVGEAQLNIKCVILIHECTGLAVIGIGCFHWFLEGAKEALQRYQFATICDLHITQFL